MRRNKKLKLGIYGHPNAGKTTLANAICEDWVGKSLGKVSEIPHETRKVNFQREVVIEKDGAKLIFDIVDTPGITTKVDYRKFLEFGLPPDEAKKRAKEATKGVIEAIKWLNDVDGVLLVMDSTRDPLTQANVTIIGNLEARDIPFFIVANKIDLPEAKPQKIESIFPQHIVVPISALKKENLDKLYETMLRTFR